MYRGGSKIFAKIKKHVICELYLNKNVAIGILLLYLNTMYMHIENSGRTYTKIFTLAVSGGGVFLRTLFIAVLFQFFSYKHASFFYDQETQNILILKICVTELNL